MEKSSESNANTDPKSGRKPYSQSFLGLWIPIEILDHSEFSAAEKILLAEIVVLQKDDGCWAGNEHFAHLIGVKARMVRAYITKLEEAGFIRSENRSSKRRRLWVGAKLRAILNRAGTDNRPIVEAKPASNEAYDAGLKSPKANETRHSSAITPGNLRENVATDRRSTRQGTATENTERGQRKNTKENTKGLDFSIPDWMPASLWEKWLTHLHQVGRQLTSMQMQAHIDELERLEFEGHPFKMVMEHAIQNGWKSFHPLPASKKPGQFTDRMGRHWFGGRIVR